MNIPQTPTSAECTSSNSANSSTSNQHSENTPHNTPPIKRSISQSHQPQQNSETQQTPTEEKEKKSQQEVKATEYCPRNERRGILTFFLISNEAVHPYQYPKRTKSVILLVNALAGAIGPMGGAVFLPAMEEICEQFNTTKDIVNISYGTYVLSLAFFPLWWSSLSEQFGRRSIFIISFICYIGFVIACALSQSIAMLMVFRFFSGACAAAIQALGAGTMSDIYVPTERGTAMGYFYLGPLLGPLVGPIFGGLLVDRFTWRGTMWFLVIISGVITVAMIVLVPETLHGRLPNNNNKNNSDSNKNEKTIVQDEEEEEDTKSAQKNLTTEKTNSSESVSNEPTLLVSATRNDTILIDNNRNEPEFPIATLTYTGEPLPSTERDIYIEQELGGAAELSKVKTTASEKEQRLIKFSGPVDFTTLTYSQKAYHLIIRPFYSFKFLAYPPVTLAIINGAICFMNLYFFNVGLETLYTSSPYNFSPILVGLTYIPNSVGYVISSIAAGKYSDHVVRKVKAKHGSFPAESRFAIHVYIAMVGYTISIFFFGWTAYYQLHWVIPLIGSFLFGLTSMVLLASTATYLVDALPGKGSSGIALNNFIRFLLAAVSTFVAEPWKEGMGFGWMYTILGFIAALSSITIIMIRKWGNKWRSQADFEKMYA